MIKMVPKIPLGAYPQLALWGHRGTAPIRSRIRTISNIVPSMMSPLKLVFSKYYHET